MRHPKDCCCVDCVWDRDNKPAVIKRLPTKQARRNTLRHAVRTRDLDALADYDDLKPK